MQHHHHHGHICSSSAKHKMNDDNDPKPHADLDLIQDVGMQLGRLGSRVIPS